MTIEDLGYNDSIAGYIIENGLKDLTPGRVTQEHRERYVVSTGVHEYEAEITGNMRFTASSREDFPAVGDWVVMMIYDTMAIIHHVLPRKTVLERQATSRPGEKQIISANVDTAFIVQSIDYNFNVNRLERYMAICLSAAIEPVLVISKTDLASEDEIRDAIARVKERHPGLKFILLSNLTRDGLDQITGYMEKGRTYCLAGSSGVGKSTLINNLMNRNILKTQEISTSTNKGRHTTAHRELIVLDNGAIIIDTPGMRELGMTDDYEGIKNTFQEIFDLTLKCRLPGCTHVNEKDCAVTEALEKGVINMNSLENFRRMQREQARFTASEAERRKKDRQFGKMAKEIMKEKKKNKF